MIKRIFQPVLDSILFSNFFIAACAMAQVALTYRLLNAPVDKGMALLIGSATFFLYNFSLLLSRPEDFRNSPYRRTIWFFSHYKLLLSLSLLCCLAMIPLALKLSLSSFILLCGIAVFAFSYNLPVLKIGRQRLSLRSLPGTKLFIIAAVWACSCVWVPILELRSQGFYVSHLDAFLLIFKRLLFVLAITLPFDMRDIYQDRQFNLKTIPVLIGSRNSYILCQLLLLIYMILLLLFSPARPYITLALFIAILITGVLLQGAKKRPGEYYYFLLLDGTLILQFALVEASIKLS